MLLEMFLIKSLIMFLVVRTEMQKLFVVGARVQVILLAKKTLQCLMDTSRRLKMCCFESCFFERLHPFLHPLIFFPLTFLAFLFLPHSFYFFPFLSSSRYTLFPPFCLSGVLSLSVYLPEGGSLHSLGSILCNKLHTNAGS